jgi:hypothetical protein
MSNRELKQVTRTKAIADAPLELREITLIVVGIQDRCCAASPI